MDDVIVGESSVTTQKFKKLSSAHVGVLQGVAMKLRRSKGDVIDMDKQGSLPLDDVVISLSDAMRSVHSALEDPQEPMLADRLEGNLRWMDDDVRHTLAAVKSIHAAVSEDDGGTDLTAVVGMLEDASAAVSEVRETIDGQNGTTVVIS